MSQFRCQTVSKLTAGPNGQRCAYVSEGRFGPVKFHMSVVQTRALQLKRLSQCSRLRTSTAVAWESQSCCELCWSHVMAHGGLWLGCFLG